MTLRVEQGKGQRDRYVMLSPQLLELLRDWWYAARPQVWLFPGQNPRGQTGDQRLIARAQTEEPVRSISIAVAGRDSDARKRASRALSPEAATADPFVRRLEGHDPCRHRSSHTTPGAGPRYPCRLHLLVLRDAKVRTRNHGVAGAAGRSGARGIWSRSQANAQPDETGARSKLRPLLEGRGRRPYATQSRGRSRPLGAHRERARRARSQAAGSEGCTRRRQSQSPADGANSALDVLAAVEPGRLVAGDQRDPLVDVS